MISQTLMMAEGRLRQEPLRLRMAELKNHHTKLTEKLRALELETKHSMLSIPEQRDLLLQKVRLT